MIPGTSKALSKAGCETPSEFEEENKSSSAESSSVSPHDPVVSQDVSTSASQDQNRPAKSQSLPAGSFFPSHILSLPSPVPCTGVTPPHSGNSMAHLTFPQFVPCQGQVSGARYRHLSLPLSTPPYLFSDNTFTPSPCHMSQLMDMGVTEKAATKALYWTGNSCIERASNWIFERPEASLKTPLEVEIKMLKADLDIKEEEGEIRDRIVSIDSGVHLMEDDMMFQAWEIEQMDVTDMSEDCDMYKLVLVINKSHQLGPGQMTEVVSKTTAHMLAKVAMSEFGEEQLDMWEACGQQVVVMEGKNTRHLLDLRLAAECLGVEWVEEGDVWDRVKKRYMEVMVLGIWGDENAVHNVVGRLVEVA
eukprot:GFUD01019247.1.p1 GENE.GFUD01019247.1~~GFUD01019247.1.p1  ORF type:complete len:361 (-),score=123.07 GFUD01019247.1:49-1131(-)